MKILGCLIITAIGLFYLVINYSSSSTLYRCDTVATEMTVQRFALRVDDYRWWVGLWSKADGRTLVEYPDGARRYFFNGQEDQDTWTFYDGDYNPADPNYVLLSKLTGRAVIWTGTSKLEGLCMAVPFR